MAALQVARGYDMPSRHQDVDDLICRPVAFLSRDTHGFTEKTFVIREESKPIGELVVHETANGPLITVLLETT
jgi:hypothetical protein